MTEHPETVLRAGLAELDPIEVRMGDIGEHGSTPLNDQQLAPPTVPSFAKVSDVPVRPHPGSPISEGSLIGI